MNVYKVTARSINIHAGILGLNPSQADARMNRLTALGGNRYEVRDSPVCFKRGEFFGFEGELPKALWGSIEAFGRRPGAIARAQTRNASKRRWVKRSEVCEKILHDWQKDRFRFGTSVAKASIGYSDWLVEQGYKKYVPRVVARWIYAHAKKRGIKLK